MTDLQYNLNSDIIFRKEGEDSFLFDPSTGRLRILNETGTMIYERLLRKLSRKEIIDSILSEYDNVRRKDIEKDLDAFTDQMIESCVLTICD